MEILVNLSEKSNIIIKYYFLCVFIYIIIPHKNIIMRLVFTYKVLYNIIKIFGLVSVLMIMRCLYEKTKY